jgi:outer membrane murein-binding lipoprotein Lpp
MRLAVSTFNRPLLIFWSSRPKTAGNTNQKLMKIHYFALGLVAVGALVLSGCASDATTTTQTQTDPSKRVYTQEELRKTGETNPAAALEKTDPSVRMSGSR